MSHGRYAPDTLEPANPWWKQAHCKGMTGLFFSQKAQDITRAKFICERCPVLASCRADIMTFEEGTSRNFRDGLCGGLTAAERWEMDPKAPRRNPPDVADEADGGPPHGDWHRYAAGCRCEPCREARRAYRADLAERNKRWKAQAEAAAAQLQPVPVLAGCGTLPAYQRHRRNNEPTDDACRAANAAAYQRYRATGTTKVLVS